MFTRSKNGKKLMPGMALLAVALISILSPARASEQRAWDVKLQTEELQRQFVYRGSTINAVAKIKTKFALSTNPDEAKEYEAVWYHDGKPIGMEKLAEFNIGRGDILYVKVSHKKSPGEEECKAAAFSLMRMSLSAYHKANSIITMTIPTESFSRISNELQARGCKEIPQKADQSNAGQVRFNLESEPEGMRQHLFFVTGQGS
ncbi:MAG: hypothetical protein SGJ27_27010 [Candidatus Melainabacteria bacterium]|nr:hypothetical protein [Candidatus Melainabacteria bacterium]